MDKKEMTAVEYLKEKMRLTDGCAIECSVCRLSNYNNGKRTDCEAFQLEYPEKAVAIVQKWAEENPVKTFLSDLLEKYPNVVMDDRGVPKFNCPYYLGYEKVNTCPNSNSDCVACWNRPLEG